MRSISFQLMGGGGRRWWVVVVLVCRGDGGNSMLCFMRWSSPGVLTGSASLVGANTSLHRNQLDCRVVCCQQSQWTPDSMNCR